MTAPQAATQCSNCGHQFRVSERYQARTIQCRHCGFAHTRPRTQQSVSGTAPASPLPTDRYRIEAVLGGGGLGRVYLARHLLLDEPCVVKALGPDDPGYSPAACERLAREARAGYRVHHPGVVRVLDVYESDQTWYLVMEFADGANLAEVLEENDRLCWMQVVAIGAQAADALATIHRTGLVHRDIKPTNIILQPDGSVKIADLGLAAPLSEVANPGSETGAVGTPPYMPPEQRDPSAALSQQADVYALGATLYHLLTGHQPQRNKSPLAYLCGEEHEPIVWDREITPPIPEWLRELIETCLAQSVEQRFYEASEVSRRLAQRLPAPGGDETREKPAGPTRGRAIAVVALANRGDSERDHWVGETLADHISYRVVESPELHLLDRQEFGMLVERLCGKPPVDASDDELAKVSRLAGAATVIRGTFIVKGETATVETYAVNVADGTTNHLATCADALSAILSYEVDLGSIVMKELGYEATTSDSGRVFPKGTTDPTALCCYAEAQRLFADGDYAEAINRAKAALDTDPNFVDLIGFIGVCYARQGSYDSAIEYHKRLKEIAEESNNLYRLAEAVSNMGVMHYFKGEYAAAYELLQSANRLEQQLNLLPILSRNYTNLGFVLAKMERLEEADTAFCQSIEIMNELGTVASLISPYNGRGEVALQRGRYKEAASHYGTALEWAERIQDHVNAGISHVNLGRCACYMGALDEADQHFQTAFEKLKRSSFWHGQALAYEHTAELNLLRGRVDDAFTCIEERIKLAQRHGNRRMEAAAWEQKARAFELSGQSDTAVDCLRKSFEIARRPPPTDNLYEYLEAIARRLPYAQGTASP